MRVHNDVTLKRVKELRKAGKSINSISQELKIPKTTIWHHVHEIELSAKQRAALNANQGGSKKRKEGQIEIASQRASELLSGPLGRECTTLAMLYWAEGNKREFTFTNTDGQMVKLFVMMMIRSLGVKKERVVLVIRYFTGMNKARCYKFWTKLLDIPKDQVRMYYNDGGNVGRTEYGVCRILVRKGAYELKVIQALIGQIAMLP